MPLTPKEMAKLLLHNGFVKVKSNNGSHSKFYNAKTKVVVIVQFSLDSNRFEYSLDGSVKNFGKENIIGRFKLVPTSNKYNFLLLDQLDGRVWQVQWGFEEKDRMVIPIK